MKVVARIPADPKGLRVLEDCGSVDKVAEKLQELDILAGKEVRIVRRGGREGPMGDGEVVYVKTLQKKKLPEAAKPGQRGGGLMEQLQLLSNLNLNAGGVGNSAPARPAHSAPDILDTDERFIFLKDMMCGEVSDAVLRKALYNSSLDTEQAAEWLVLHMEDDDLNTPVTEQQLAQLFPPPIPDPTELSNQLSLHLQQILGSA